MKFVNMLYEIVCLCFSYPINYNFLLSLLTNTFYTYTHTIYKKIFWINQVISSGLYYYYYHVLKVKKEIYGLDNNEVMD